MRIALLGGTGDIGEGLALRLAYHTDHAVVVGSRNPEKARTKAAEYETELASRGVEQKVTGFENGMATDRADVVVLSVPAYHAKDTVVAVADKLDAETTLVTPAVGMNRTDDGLRYNPPGAGSVSQLVAQHVPTEVSVVGAFHNLAADRLANLDVDLDLDTLLVGDDADAKQTIADIASRIDGLRPLDAGALANAPEVESLTPLLVNLAIHNEGMHDVGVTFE